ncbi:tRNA lysidine(34) synthetase TilS [Erythrobacter sp. SDW2]|uniref:tRNA lysidine(34) synthetase TilS n=1 Tax=Erythrobacter sp. SDW2 TaxID=2907154 RepID=UPI001F446A8E|nr:tRNA lysidine(34) synthetase TilS [Erythrobacter sp. SDW2]UIP06646.1 tRNA lysidine(34) synthetase TilS [Erythrobacter sp. SDW2]
MALLLLGYEALDGKVAVATVNHGLRPEAAAECALVARQCERLGVRCDILDVKVAAGNVQHEARSARYDALLDWADQRGVGAVATAHHADDQLETILMRLNRGSGLKGMRGISRKIWLEGHGTPIVRPLLGFRRTELLRLVESCGVEFAFDPSNEDDRFDRARLRKALADADWLDPHAIARSAAYLAEADSTLEAVAGKLWDRGAEVGADQVSVPRTNHHDANARLLVRAGKALGIALAYGEVMGLLKSQLSRGNSKANVGGALIERREDVFLVRPEPPRRTG